MRAFTQIHFHELGRQAEQGEQQLGSVTSESPCLVSAGSSFLWSEALAIMDHAPVSENLGNAITAGSYG